MAELYSELDLSEQVLTMTRNAINNCSMQQQQIYQLVHGVYQDGTITEPMTLEQAARALGWSRGAARWHLAIAQAIIFKTIAQKLIEVEYQRREAFKLPTPNETFEDYQNKIFFDPQFTVKYRTHAKNKVVLGCGSQEMENAGKAGGRERRNKYNTDIHQRYAK